MPVAQVSDRIRLREPVPVHVVDALHPKRREDARRDELQKRHAARLLHDHPGDDVSGVAVLVLRARLEIERLPGPALHDLIGRRLASHEGGNVVLRPVVLITRRVRQQLPDRYFVRARQIRNVFPDFVIK